MPALAPELDCHTGFAPPSPVEADAVMAELRADLGDRYEPSRFLARGGFATVWEAKDRVAGRAVAVKKLDPRPTRSGDFFRELRAMFRLNHPSVVRLVNFLEVVERRYLILELCRGGSLRAAMSRARTSGVKCPHERVVSLIRSVAQGLAAAHAEGLTHRDIKPENLLFGERDDRPFGGLAALRIADFGLACVRPPRDDGRLRSVTGSPAYMAPEQFSGTFGPASDVYALGVVAFELLTGDVPFHGLPGELGYKHLHERPAVSNDLPAPWPDLLRTTLAKNPDDRPTAADVAKALADGNDDVVRTPPPTKALRVLRVIAPERECPADGTLLSSVAPGCLISGGTGVGVLTDDGNVVPLPTRDRPLAAGGDRVVTPSAAWKRVDGNWSVEMKWPEPVVCAAVGPNDVVTASNDRLTRWRSGQIIWSHPLDSRHATLRVAVLGDGNVAIAKLGERSEVTFLGPDGGERDRCVLPGLARSILAVGPDVVVRVLTGSGYRLVKVVLGHGPERLRGSSNVLTVATDGTDTVGAWADGRVAEWRADGCRVDYRVAPIGGRVVSLVAGPTHVMLLIAGAPTTVVRVLRPKR